MSNQIKVIVITSAVWVAIIVIGFLYTSSKIETNNAKYMNEKLQVKSIQDAVSNYDKNNEIFVLDFTRSSLDKNFDFIANYATACTKIIHTTGTYKNGEIRISSFNVTKKVQGVLNDKH